MKKALLAYTFVAALGGLLFGFDTAVTMEPCRFSLTISGWIRQDRAGL